MTHTELVTYLLDRACPNCVDDEGFNTYYIELHCRAFTITARKRNDTWEIRAIAKEGE